MQHRLDSRLVRIVSVLSLFGTLTLGIAFGAHGTARAGDDEAVPCTAKKFSFSQVEEACKKGGRKAAKAMMKEIVKKAKAGGEELKCQSCHKDLKNFELKDDAVTQLKKWL